MHTQESVDRCNVGRVLALKNARPPPQPPASCFNTSGLVTPFSRLEYIHCFTSAGRQGPSTVPISA
jgi:hypothetical protein